MSILISNESSLNIFYRPILGPYTFNPARRLSNQSVDGDRQSEDIDYVTDSTLTSSETTLILLSQYEEDLITQYRKSLGHFNRYGKGNQQVRRMNKWQQIRNERHYPYNRNLNRGKQDVNKWNRNTRRNINQNFRNVQNRAKTYQEFKANNQQKPAEGNDQSHASNQQNIFRMRGNRKNHEQTKWQTINQFHTRSTHHLWHQYLHYLKVMKEKQQSHNTKIISTTVTYQTSHKTDPKRNTNKENQVTPKLNQAVIDESINIKPYVKPKVQTKENSDAQTNDNEDFKNIITTHQGTEQAIIIRPSTPIAGYRLRPLQIPSHFTAEHNIKSKGKQKKTVFTVAHQISNNKGEIERQHQFRKGKSNLNENSIKKKVIQHDPKNTKNKLNQKQYEIRLQIPNKLLKNKHPVHIILLKSTPNNEDEEIASINPKRMYHKKTKIIRNKNNFSSNYEMIQYSKPKTKNPNGKWNNRDLILTRKRLSKTTKNLDLNEYTPKNHDSYQNVNQKRGSQNHQLNNKKKGKINAGNKNFKSKSIWKHKKFKSSPKILPSMTTTDFYFDLSEPEEMKVIDPNDSNQIDLTTVPPDFTAPRRPFADDVDYYNEVMNDYNIDENSPNQAEIPPNQGEMPPNQAEIPQNQAEIQPNLKNMDSVNKRRQYEVNILPTISTVFAEYDDNHDESSVTIVTTAPSVLKISTVSIEPPKFNFLSVLGELMM